MDGKTVLITGATDGIGLATAKELAKRGARIILHGRSRQKAEQAVERIRSETANAHVRYVLADFLSLQSVRNVAQEVLRQTERVDVLINNAGATFSRFELSEDGLEKTIATNHFAPFLLTGLLLEHIRKSEVARIINVASDAHRQFFSRGIDFDSFKTGRGYFIMKSYAQSKLANILFTLELAEQLKRTQVTVNAIHPGTVRTDIGTKPAMKRWHAFAWGRLQKPLALSLEQGARTSVYLAESDEVQGVTGKYFRSCNSLNLPWKKTRIVEPSKRARDAEVRRKLWDLSEAYCGIRYPV